MNDEKNEVALDADDLENLLTLGVLRSKKPVIKIDVEPDEWARVVAAAKQAQEQSEEAEGDGESYDDLEEDEDSEDLEDEDFDDESDETEDEFDDDARDEEDDA